MKNKLFLLFATVLVLTGCGGNTNSQSTSIDVGSDVVDYDSSKSESGDQFDFDGNYTASELTIDGKNEEEQWKSASEFISFGAVSQAKASIYLGSTALFCYFEVADVDIETVGQNNGDDVTKGDSVEIYFDFKNDASSTPQSDDIQLNIGAHGKTRIFVGSTGTWGSWNGLLDYEILLNGTLNNDEDVDVGYSIELMIPYAQVGITRDSIFGVSFGCVAKGKDSTNETLPYTWGGLVFDGTFIDPQSPVTYVVLYNRKFYSRSNVPMDNITIKGKVVNQENTPLTGIELKVGDTKITTDSSGLYSLSNINPNISYLLQINKEGYKSYEVEILPKDMRNAINFVYQYNIVLIDKNIHKSISIIGEIKNPSEGIIENCKVTIGASSTLSKADGTFALSVEIDNELEIICEKENYKTAIISINIEKLLGKESFDTGLVPLYSPSSLFSFGGARGITACNCEVYRGLEGINFVFKTEKAVTNGDHIELFIDAGSSFSGRDSSDYRIDFKGDGTFNIVNFGGGTNTIGSTSGITNNSYLLGTTYYMEGFIPYKFLSIENSSIIGISAGVWSQSLSDWDGWNFSGTGFADYVAPEYTDQYCRIGLDNGLYRALNNSVTATKIYGTVLDSANNPIAQATVNGHIVNSDGSFAIWEINGSDVTLSFRADGYIGEDITVTKDNLNGKPYKLVITLSLSQANISGTCNVDGAKVYLESDTNISCIVTDGKYSINVPTDSNAYLIFEKTGFVKVRKAFGKASLIANAKAGTSIIYNCTMVAE